MKKRNIFIASLIFTVFLCSVFLIPNNFLSFVTAFCRNQERIGAILPSSSFLAKSMTKHISLKDRPIKILEVGAGTGVFTKKALEKIRQCDVLDVIEIDNDLCGILKEKFAEHKNVHIHCMSILDWNPDYKYDFIVSGLPFNSLSVDFVISVLEKYKKLIKDSGIISYFEYIWVSHIKKFFSSGQKKADYVKNISIMKNFIKSFEFDRDFVFLNIPPAYAYHLKVKK